MAATDLPVVDVGGAEVDDDVGDKHDVDKYVDHEQWVQRLFRGVDRCRLGRRLAVVERRTAGVALAQQEGGRVRREDGRVEHEEQGDPVPDGLERRVVQNDEAWHGRRRRTTADPHPDRVDVAAGCGI